MNAREEIEELRALEARIGRQDIELGKLQNELAFRYRGHLVIFDFMPIGTWAYLPAMWQSAKELRLTPRVGLPPRDAKRSIAVSIDVAKALVR